MSDTPNSILIFAAGFGARMGELTANKPKPLVPVSGKPMINHAIEITRNAGISKITVNLHYKHQMLTDHLSGQNIQFSIETPNILDTGGGLRQALPLTGEGAILTLNPDAIWVGENPISMLLSAWDPIKMDALLMLVPPENADEHTGKGDFLLRSDGQLDRGQGLVYSGAQIIKTDLLKEIQQPVFSLNLLWDIIGKNKTLFGLSYTGKWCDVGTQQGVLAAEKVLKNAHV